MDHPLRRTRLVARLPEIGVDAMLVTRLPNVRYVTGFTGSNAQLLLGAESGVFFTDGRYAEQSRREVPELRRDIYTADFPAAFARACRDLGLSRVGFEAAGVTYRFYQDISGAEAVELVPVTKEVERLRWIKELEEIRLLDRAQALTDEAYDRVVAKLAEGVTEREVALELEWAMRQSGAEGVSFDSIVAFGENSAEPHHRPTDRPLSRGDVVKLDFGARFEGYHADMTRTLSFGEPRAQLREVYGLVLAAQLAGVEAVRAGVSGADADRAARRIIEEAGYGDRFGHSLGHGVGLEVHEGPTLRSTSEDVLPAGAVVTVEPGIYVPGLGGVRIEDMVEVLEDGCRVLPATGKELLVL